MDKKTIYSWALYDWANSAYATSVMAGLFPLFFGAIAKGDLDPTSTTNYLALSNSIASFVVALLAPILGAIADHGTLKKKLLIFFAFLGILMTISMGFIMQGYWIIAFIVYIFATIGFSSANTFYDSLLPVVSNKKNVDYVSALGFALGYLGGGILIVINAAMVYFHNNIGITLIEAYQYSFISVGIWWALFSIPIVLFVDEPASHEKKSLTTAIKDGWSQFLSTIQNIKKSKVVATFLLAYWLYIDGVDTVVRMAVNLGEKLGFASEVMMVALVVVQFVAFFATLLYIKISDKIGLKNGIYLGILGYIFIIIIGSSVTEVWQLYVGVILIGCFQGGIQTLSRSLYARIIPQNKTAEFFGFFNMWGKFAAIIGPLLMAGVTTLSLRYIEANSASLVPVKVLGNGSLDKAANAIVSALTVIVKDAHHTLSARIGFLSLIILFILGAYVFSKVDVQEGERIAKEHL